MDTDDDEDVGGGGEQLELLFDPTFWLAANAVLGDVDDDDDDDESVL